MEEFVNINHNAGNEKYLSFNEMEKREPGCENKSNSPKLSSLSTNQRGTNISTQIYPHSISEYQ